MTYKVHDNFLSIEDFENLKLNFFSEDFPWYFNNYKISTNTENIYDYQFTHTLYNNFHIKSNYFNLVEPILKKIKPIALIKIKLNLTTVFKEIINYPFHTDVPTNTNTNTKTGIFYLNTNNGQTVFKNGDKIESIKNRFVEFPSDSKHAATTHTNSKTRIVINFNWV